MKKLFCLVLILSIFSCAEESISIEQPIEVTSVSLNRSDLTLTPGESFTLTATLFPDDATDKTVVWSSTNPSVATVSNGVVTALSVGSTTIVAKSGNVTAQCIVTVSPISVTSISLNRSDLTLTPGESFTLTATLSPDDATDKTVVWSSTDPSVASVSNGVVTALSVGSATIVAKSGNVTAQCVVTVSPISVTSVSLNRSDLTLTSGESFTLTATLSPDDATDKTVVWSSTNPSVATVSNGVVTALSVGSATIVAKSGNVTAQCVVTVSPISVISVSLNRSDLTLTSGESFTLTATLSPDDATDKTVVWSSTNPSVATVSNGVVTALSVGSTTIVAKSGNVTAQCVVTVSPISVTSVSLNRSDLTLTSGESFTLTATLSPDNATDRTVVWSSTDPSVASVSNGVVTALSVGSTTIIAKIGNVKAQCVVTVERKKPQTGGSEGTEEEEW